MGYGDDSLFSSFYCRRQSRAQSFRVVAHCEMAVVEYSVEGDVITFLHTRVPEAMRGQGVAKTLVRAGLDSARERGLRVIPQCPVFAAYMREHVETQDLLSDEGRAMLGL